MERGAGGIMGGREGKCSPCSSSESMDGVVFCMSSLSPEVRDAIESVKYIAENMKLENEAKEVRMLEDSHKLLHLKDMECDVFKHLHKQMSF